MRRYHGKRRCCVVLMIILLLGLITSPMWKEQLPSKYQGYIPDVIVDDPYAQFLLEVALVDAMNGHIDSAVDLTRRAVIQWVESEIEYLLEKSNESKDNKPSEISENKIQNGENIPSENNCLLGELGQLEAAY